MQFRVLGPIEVHDDEAAVLDIGGAQSRAVLAMLLVAGDRIVPVETIVDRLWPDGPPASAASTLQSYVSRLRRVLRTAGGVHRLTFESGGYRLTVPDDEVDARAFAAVADAGRAALADEAVADAQRLLTDALAMWRGPALQDVADQPWARGAATRLDERRLAAIEDRVRADLLLGRHDLVIGELNDLVDEHPLREGLWEQLAVALYRSGRQAEALRAIDELRRRLLEGLGVDPSQRIRDLERRILEHDPALAGPVSPATATLAPPTAASQHVRLGELHPGHPARGGRHFRGVVTERLVGRGAELAALGAVLDAAAEGRTQWVLFEGEPGIGKTRLLEQLAEEATGRGFDVLWGRSYEAGAAPAFWPWMGTINGLHDVAAELPVHFAAAIDELQWAAGPRTPADTDRYHLFEAIAQLIQYAARRGPMMIALDDLQWADAPSLELIQFLAGYVIGSAVLFAFTVRELEIGRNDAVVHALGDLARRPNARRLRLGGLALPDAQALVGEAIGGRATDEVVRAIHARSGGNPFFMNELARLLAADPGLTEGEVVRRIGVPAGVRDVVHRRLAHLAAPTAEVLQMAAVLDPLADVALLAAALDVAVDECLDRIEPALVERLLVEDADVLGAVHFSHGLVREVVLDDMSALRRARLHLRAADAIEGRGFADDEVAGLLAEHLWQASAIGIAERAAVALEHAAEVAMARYGFEQADHHLTRALQLRRSLPAGQSDQGAELTTINRLAAVRRARLGFERAARQTPITRAKELARASHDDVLLIDLLWTEWAGAATSCQLDEADRLAREMLELARRTTDPIVVAAADASWGIQCWHEGRITESMVTLDRATAVFLDNGLVEPTGSVAAPLVEHGILSVAFAGLVHELAGEPLPGHSLVRGSTTASLAPHQRLVLHLAHAMGAMVAESWAEARRAAELALDVPVAVDFGFFLAGARCVRGVARVGLGDPAGLDDLVTGTEEYLASGARTVIPCYLAHRAVAHLGVGDLLAAQQAVQRARDIVGRSGERWSEPFVLLAEAKVAAGGGAPAQEVDATLRAAWRAALDQGAHGTARTVAANAERLGVTLA